MTDLITNGLEGLQGATVDVIDSKRSVGFTGSYRGRN
jgi:hypothetical protein